jgi:5-methylcytosine-specific restriction enzyme subunit McrC
MLLLNYRPDITGGAENVIAILFDMNKLWEEFVYRRLKREELNFVFQIKRQQSENFWKLESSKHNKTIRPDIVIKVNEETIVLDTKWKIIEDLLPDDDDLKQMYIYNLFWNCNGSILLYPSAKENCVHGDYNDYRKKGEIWTRCTVQTLNILDNENKLDKLLGQRLIEKLIKPASNKTGRNE